MIAGAIFAGARAGTPEAPADGRLYSRIDGSWVPTASATAEMGFARQGNAVGGAPLNHEGGALCNLGLFQGMPVAQDGTITTVSWTRDDADAGTLQLAVFRGASITQSVAIPVPAATPNGVEVVSVPVLAGDEIYMGVHISTANPLTGLAVTVAMEVTP